MRIFGTFLTKHVRLYTLFLKRIMVNQIPLNFFKSFHRSQWIIFLFFFRITSSSIFVHASAFLFAAERFIVSAWFGEKQKDLDVGVSRIFYSCFRLRRKNLLKRAHNDKLYATQNQRANKGCACIRILRRDDLPYCRFTGASSLNLHPLMIMHAPFRPFRMCGA
jgi:hypothetical protein